MSQKTNFTKETYSHFLEIVEEAFIFIKNNIGNVNKHSEDIITPNKLPGVLQLWDHNIIKKIYTGWLCSENIIFDAEIVSKLDDVYNMLSDESSRDIFRWFIKFNLVRGVINNIIETEKLVPYPSKTNAQIYYKYFKKVEKVDNCISIDGYLLNTDELELVETWVGEIYLHEQCKPSKGDVVMDIGGYKGETAIWYAKSIGDKGKVHSFEVVPKHIELLKENIERNNLSETIQVIEKGLFNENTTMYINEKGDCSTCNFDKGDFKAEVITLDSFVENNNIKKLSIIKMDIEGAELDALKGAIKTIKKYKPKLVISLYHNDYDIINIPFFVKSIVPNYEIYLSHKVPSIGGTLMIATI